RKPARKSLGVEDFLNFAGDFVSHRSREISPAPKSIPEFPSAFFLRPKTPRPSRRHSAFLPRRQIFQTGIPRSASFSFQHRSPAKKSRVYAEEVPLNSPANPGGHHETVERLPCKD